MDPYALGASLYVPALHPDLPSILAGVRYPGLRSVIVCTEDAVADRDLPRALHGLKQALSSSLPTGHDRPLRFVRPRNPAVGKEICRGMNTQGIDGFVLPKVDAENLHTWGSLLTSAPQAKVMPTIETVRAIASDGLLALRQALLSLPWRDRVLAVRIGGNDLLHALGLRRPADRTIYDTALGPVLSQIAFAFLPEGVSVTAPVFEALDQPEVLALEVERDLYHGFYGKTAIHPSQVGTIEALYAVEPQDVEMAQALFDERRGAVFGMHGRMCEIATHARWAERTLRRYAIYGARMNRAHHHASVG